MRIYLLLTLVALVLAGCGGKARLTDQADVTCRRLAAQQTAAPAASAAAPAASDAQGLTLYFAPRAAATAAPAADAPAAPGAAAAAPDAAAPAKAAEPFASIDGRSFGAIVKEDLRQAPGRLWSGTKHTYGDPVNLIVLGAAFGADRIVRRNLDSDVREEFRHDDSSMAETGDFGSVIGNPALHFGIAGAWYAVAAARQDARQHELSRVMLEALAINGASTMLLKVSMNDRAPNDEKYGWPSGHTSSSVCFAAVLHEYYGWQAGVPLYLLAGYSAATRLEDREHDLSDLVFGAALGWVVGHSVVKGQLPQVAGFHVLPWGGPDAGGLMFLKRW